MQLVLSLFPGIGLLDMAFEEAGFCVVRGPDLLWGGDIHSFTPPAGVFAGVIGGPPCKRFSTLSNVVRARWGEGSLAPNLIPQFERVVAQARPAWFLMENVERAPLPQIAGYAVNDAVINNRWLGEIQNRVRRFCFGTPNGLPLEIELSAHRHSEFEPAVTGNNGGRRSRVVLDPSGSVRGKQGSADWQRLQRRPLERLCELQGLPRDHLSGAPFTKQGAREVVANGVPLAMGRAVAAAIVKAISATGRKPDRASAPLGRPAGAPAAREAKE